MLWNVCPDGCALPPASVNTTTATATTTTAPAIGNPIYWHDSPDPSIVVDGGKLYAYYTGGGRDSRHGRFPILRSNGKLSEWEQIGYIFVPGEAPRWARKSRNWWAPEVHKVNGRYVAYITTREDATGRFAIGAAVADKPEGPFYDIGEPIVRNESVGLIDANYFEDPNTRRKYLLWKEDQNDFNPPRPTPLIMQELSPDGLKVVGEPKELLRNDRDWEGVLVEAPTLIFENGWYYLFYSGNVYAIDEYAVGVSRSRTVWGPYEKYPEPILKHDKDFSGPGHQFLLKDDKGNWHVFYHARIKSIDARWRFMMYDTLKFGADGWPTINDGYPGALSQEMLKRITGK